MTVDVVFYGPDWEKRMSESFDSETRAAIFMDGIRARGDFRFSHIEHPDEPKIRFGSPDTGHVKPRL